MFAADTPVIDERTIETILEDAGVGKDYIRELEAALQDTLPVRAKLDFYDSMKTLQKYLAENVPTGMGLREFIDSVGKDEVMTALGISPENPHYIETVYRTNYGTAHSAGRWAASQASKSVVLLEYQAVMDNRTTPICSELNGVILPKDHPFWDAHYPLNHFSCRSTVTELTESYVEIEGIEETQTPLIDADIIHKDFNTNPGQSLDWMKPSKGMKERLASYEAP
jgi:SPP1 gp7 family putative phage head morphogenesis protein